MRKNSETFMIIAVLTICSQYSLAESDQDIAKQLRDNEKIMSLEKILRQYKALYPGRLLDVELGTEHEQFIYELEILDRQGRIRKISVDAMTGALLTKQNDD